MNESNYYNLNYENRDSETGEVLLELSLRFENPKDEEDLSKKLNTWLTGIGSKLQVKQVTKGS